MESKKKIFTTAPLPFMGQKRKFLKQFKPALQNYSPTATYVDLFGGSGSTLIACEQLNRKCYMMELTEHYCDVIINRWETLTGRKAVKIG